MFNNAELGVEKQNIKLNPEKENYPENFKPLEYIP